MLEDKILTPFLNEEETTEETGEETEEEAE